MKRIISIVLILAVAMVAFAGGSSEASTSTGVKTLKLGTTAPGGPVNGCAEYFAKSVAEVSGGKLVVDVHTASTLGNTAQLYAQLKSGDLDFFVTAFDTATVLKDGEAFAIVCVPYVFDDFDHYMKFATSDLCKEMIAKVEASNGLHFVGLGSQNMPRTLSARIPVYSVEDVKNLKLRCPETKGQFQMWEMWGANPLIINGGESYTAIEQGIADGQENDVVGSYNSGYGEILKYFMEIDYIQQANVIWGSQINWGKYTDQEKAWIEEALAKTFKEYSEETVNSYDAAKAGLIAQGVTFVDVDVDSFKQATYAAIPTLEAQGIIPAGLYDTVRALNN